jgi:hypothetical protein
MRVLDLFLKPLQWKHVFTFYPILAVYTVLRKQRPASPIIIVAILSIMPSIVSGSFTRLIGEFFGFDTIYSPLALHIHEDISDRKEVRYVLIGVFLDCIYLNHSSIAQDDKLLRTHLLGLSWRLCGNMSGKHAHLQHRALGQVLQDH